MRLSNLDKVQLPNDDNLPQRNNLFWPSHLSPLASLHQTLNGCNVDTCNVYDNSNHQQSHDYRKETTVEIIRLWRPRKVTNFSEK